MASPCSPWSPGTGLGSLEQGRRTRSHIPFPPLLCASLHYLHLPAGPLAPSAWWGKLHGGSLAPPEVIFYQVGNKADFFPCNTNKTITRYHIYQNTAAIKLKIGKRKLTTVYDSSGRGGKERKRAQSRQGNRWLTSRMAHLLYMTALERKSMPLQKIAICLKYAEVISLIIP